LFLLFSEWNQSCVTHDSSCSVCCASSECYVYENFPNACIDGCIHGHRGARCYELCGLTCKSCDKDISYCDSCFDGFYLGPKKDCKSECPSNCKTCTSFTNCITCKEGFVKKKNGSIDCRYSNCPENCYCNVSTCVMCKNVFFSTQENHARINARINALIVRFLRIVISVKMDFIVVVTRKYVQIHA
jgi:hypothetical protein